MADRAVILAGGQGRRLAPYTSILPKPLMPLFADRSIIENVLGGVAAAGIEQVTITLGYLGHLIEAVVGSGANFDLEVTYTRESTPLGTAGPLGLISNVKADDRILVVNGDTYTDLNYSLVLDRLGRECEAVITCVHRTLHSNYGVIRTDDGGFLLEYDEKPTFDMLVSTGIYGLRGSALDLVRPGLPMDMPRLLTGLQSAGRKVYCLVSDCEWKDLGRPEDFAEIQAQSGAVGRGYVH